MTGVCKWCDCEDAHACPGGCAWLDSACTLCSACGPIDVAWRDEPVRRRNMRHAFFLGFLVGARDSRVIEGQTGNPYHRMAAQHQAWERGKLAGAGAVPGR